MILIHKPTLIRKILPPESEVCKNNFPLNQRSKANEIRQENIKRIIDEMSKNLAQYIIDKYVVKHKSANLFMTYAAGKVEAALNISYLILSTSSQRLS